MEINPEINLIEVRKAYYKEWRAKNKDKVKQHNLNFWTKKAQQLRTAEEVSKDDNITDNQ